MATYVVDENEKESGAGVILGGCCGLMLLTVFLISISMAYAAREYCDDIGVQNPEECVEKILTDLAKPEQELEESQRDRSPFEEEDLDSDVTNQDNDTPNESEATEEAVSESYQETRINSTIRSTVTNDSKSKTTVCINDECFTVEN